MKISLPTLIVICTLSTLHAQPSDISIALDGITKIVVGPYVQVVLVEGEVSTFRLDYDGLSESDINVRTSGKTLKVFLDEAKFLPKKQKIHNSGWSTTRDLYDGVQVIAYVSLKELKKITVRGNEGIRCDDNIKADKLKLKLYGENDVRFASVDIGKLKVKSYGTSELRFKEGTIKKQVYRLYGEHEINARKLDNLLTKTTIFGESSLALRTSEKVKLTAFGEVDIRYSGGAKLNKAIVLGESSISEYR